jgi:hypothetical protein
MGPGGCRDERKCTEYKFPETREREKEIKFAKNKKNKNKI